MANAGWRYESARHALAAQGIKTGRRYNISMSMSAGVAKVALKVAPVAKISAPLIPAVEKLSKAPVANVTSQAYAPSVGRFIGIGKIRMPPTPPTPPTVPVVLTQMNLPKGFKWIYGKFKFKFGDKVYVGWRMAGQGGALGKEIYGADGVVLNLMKGPFPRYIPGIGPVHTMEGSQ